MDAQEQNLCAGSWEEAKLDRFSDISRASTTSARGPGVFRQTARQSGGWVLKPFRSFKSKFLGPSR